MSDLMLRLGPADLAWLRWVAGATISTGILLAAAFALDVLLRRRVEARWRVLLPAIVLLRLALPLQWTSPLGVFGLRAAAARAEVVTASVVEAPPTEVAPSSVAPAPAPHAGLPSMAPVLHAGVALALLGVALASRWRASSALREARPARESVALLAVGVPVVEHDALGPAVVGLLRPRIVMPSPLVDALAEEEVASVLRHEVAHVRRRDPIMRALVQVATFAAWPVLPAWLAAWWLRGLVEQACDERALEGGGAQARGVHARALVDVATWRPQTLRLALGLLPFGEGVRARVKALRFSRRWATPAQVACVVVVAPMLVLTLGARAEAPAAAPEPVASAAGRSARVRHVPPLLRLRVEAYRGSEDAPDGPLDAAAAETLRARLAANGAPLHDSFLAVLVGEHGTTRVAADGEGGAPEFVFPTFAPALEDDRLVVTVSTIEKPSEETTTLRWIVEPGQPLHLACLASSPSGRVHLLVTPENVAFPPGAAPRVDSVRATLDMADATLDAAAQRLGEIGGTGILVDRPLADRKVSLMMADVAWEEAVDRLVAAAGVDWELAHGLVKLVPRLEGAHVVSRSVPPLDPALAARIEEAVTREGVHGVSVRATPDDIVVNARTSSREAVAAVLRDVGKAFGVKDVFVLTPESDGSFEFGMHLSAPFTVQAELELVRLDHAADVEPLHAGTTIAPLAEGAVADARIVVRIPATAGDDDALEPMLDRLTGEGGMRVLARPIVVAQAEQSFSISTTMGDVTAKLDLTVHGTPGALSADVVLDLPWIPGEPISIHVPSERALVEIAEPDGGATLVAIHLRPVGDAP